MKRLFVCLLLIAGLVLSACDSGGESDEQGDEGGTLAECTDDFPSDTAVGGVPEDFPKPDGAVYTGGDEAGPSFIAEGAFDGDISEAFEAYEAAFEDSGYDVTKDEQEEKDAEVFFAGEGTTGQVNMFAECAGRTKLRITIRPD